MKKTVKLARLAAIVLTGTVAFSSCSSSDDVPDNVVLDENGTAGVKPEFVISLPRTVVGTRMSNAVTQSSGAVKDFRGMDNIRLVAFDHVPGEGSAKMDADILRLSAIGKSGDLKGSSNYKVYADQFVPVGATNFLFYGKAIDVDANVAITTMDEKFTYGTLTAEGLTNTGFSTSNITFGLEQINISSSAQAGNSVGQNLVQLLTALMNASVTGATAPDDKFSTTTNPVLSNLYANLKATTTGSSSSVAAILAKMYVSLGRVQTTAPAYALATHLRSLILTACTTAPGADAPASLTSAYSGYPGNVGLPDGAARIRWNVATGTFVDITANYSLGNRAKITDYAYPAALWYYVNTPLKASDEVQSRNYGADDSWSDIMGTVYKNAATAVQNTTQSVALENPAQYGVGRVATMVKMNTGTYYDGNGEEVNVLNGFTLKGLLLGGQNSVGFDFTKKGNENLTIYDKTMPGTIIATPGDVTSANQTLALETATDVPVYAALELVNRGEEFMGADGIIPAGGTFYLTVQLNPATAGGGKIVWQDHVTMVTVTINNGNTVADRNGDGTPDVYLKDANGVPTGVDVDGDGTPDSYDIDGDGTPDTFITDPVHGGPGWDTDGDGEVDIPLTPDKDGNYPAAPNVPEGLGKATNGIPDLKSPGIEIGTSVNLEWLPGLVLNPSV